MGRAIDVRAETPVNGRATSASSLGGWFADRLSPRTVLLLTLAVYLLAFVTIPLVDYGSWVMFGVLMIWACIGWMISPVEQSFLDLGRSGDGWCRHRLNLSTMHTGVRLGTAIGGIALANLSVHALSWVGAPSRRLRWLRVAARSGRRGWR